MAPVCFNLYTNKIRKNKIQKIQSDKYIRIMKYCTSEGIYQLRINVVKCSGISLVNLFLHFTQQMFLTDIPLNHSAVNIKLA